MFQRVNLIGFVRLMINFSNLSANDKMNFVNLFVEKIVIDKEHNIRIKWKRQ